jgi:hypothetical protein
MANDNELEFEAWENFNDEFSHHISNSVPAKDPAEIATQRSAFHIRLRFRLSNSSLARLGDTCEISHVGLEDDREG